MTAESAKEAVAAELAAAEAAEADLAGRYRDAIAALERAVADADVATVMRLRGDTEIALPQQLGVARARLLAAQVAQGEVALAEARAKASDARAAGDAAREALDEAETRLKDAWSAVHEATNAGTTAQMKVGWAEVRLQKLRDDHAAHTASHEQDQERRLRRLAGLPDAQVVAS
jgi:exonuclease VII small subunit